ncbi:MAG TPA: hypothetical protein GXX40_05605 [Firmicutes bacterium]|nr:hypothetical protein [Bacillota bacterium]
MFNTLSSATQKRKADPEKKGVGLALLRGVVRLISVGAYIAYYQPYIWRLLQRRFGLQGCNKDRELVLTAEEAKRLMQHDAHRRVRGAIRQVRWE